MWVALYVAAIVLLNWLFTPSMSIEGVTQWTTPIGILYISNIVLRMRRSIIDQPSAASW